MAIKTINDAKNIRAKVLVLHSANDPYVPEEQVKAFENDCALRRKFL